MNGELEERRRKSVKQRGIKVRRHLHQSWFWMNLDGMWIKLLQFDLRSGYGGEECSIGSMYVLLDTVEEDDMGPTVLGLTNLHDIMK